MATPSTWRFLLPVPLLFGIAVRAASPGVTAGGDAAELVSAAATLGPAHPPGYPLWVLLGRLFTLIPAGTVAFRVTLLSCTAFALSYPFLASAAERLLEGRLPSPGFRAWTAGVLCFFALSSPMVLAQFQGAEVYTLFFLQSALLLWLMTRTTPAGFLLLAFALGATLAHHYLVVVALPALAAARWGRFPRPKAALRAMALLVVGLSPVLVLVLRSRLDPAADWGNPDVLSRFLRHLVRTQYMGMGRADLLAGWNNLLHYSSTFLRETWGVGLLLLPAVLRRDLRVWTLAAGMQLVVLPFMLLIEQDPVSFAVIDSYFPPAYIWSAPLLAAGTAELLARLSSRAARGGLLTLLALLAAWHAVWAFGQADGSRNLALERTGRNVLLALPERAAFYSRGDSPTFVLFHLKTVERLRPDVTVADRTGGTFRDAYRLLGRHVPDLSGTLTGIEKAWDAANPGRRTFYSEANGVPGRPLRPFGVVFAAAREDEPAREAEFWRRAVPPGAGTHDEFFTRTEEGNFRLFRGWWRLRVGDEAGARREFALIRRVAGQDGRLLGFLSAVYLARGWKAEAEQVNRDILAFAPGNVDALFRLGLLAEQGGLRPEAEAHYRRALESDPARHDVRNNLAALLLDQGRTAEAGRELDSILKQDPDQPDAVKNMALLLWGSDPERSKDLFRRYLRLVPDSLEREAIERALR
jgi:tetratricopeptide (TPR) repeat protein